MQASFHVEGSEDLLPSHAVPSRGACLREAGSAGQRPEQAPGCEAQGVSEPWDLPLPHTVTPPTQFMVPTHLHP